ncbi:hypothetical protein [Nonlabens xiamenensis]|uniref:hypothetical protein n=1 Tax=Nonlabens xiamenensis TaxID=2341043 RepID=UPI000F611AC1|nr:hypothetical protein [Nonlabens xiamenensis]
MKRYLILFSFFWSLLVFPPTTNAQESQENTTVNVGTGIHQPNLVSTHPLGLFFARVGPNFNTKVTAGTTLNFQVQSGNVFQPPVEVYLPDDPALRETFSNQPWFFRSFDYIDQETTPAQRMDLHFDAVYKVYRMSVDIPLNQQHQLSVGVRAFQTISGNFVNSPLTNDESIEWFHRNVAGGPDPFGREFYGLNQVVVDYTDRNGRQLKMQENEMILGGLELVYRYSPTLTHWNQKGWSLNLQAHLGWNTSKYNPSLDVGAGSSLIKSILLTNKSWLNAGLGLHVTAKNFSRNEDVLDTGNNNFMGVGEVTLQWSHKTRHGNWNSLGVNYQYQTPFFKREEADYFHLKGDWDAINQGWHHAYTTLIEELTGWSLIYSHQREVWGISVYLREDLDVHNAPDVETGIQLNFLLDRPKS